MENTFKIIKKKYKKTQMNFFSFFGFKYLSHTRFTQINTQNLVYIYFQNQGICCCFYFKINNKFSFFIYFKN